MLAPISWRVPPRNYGPWEQFASLLTEGLVERGVDVTLFATADSITRARLIGTAPTGYSEDPALDAKVWESLHIAALFERAGEFDVIHNSRDYAATIHHGIDMSAFELEREPGDHLLFFGRIHPDKGTVEAIDAAEHAGMPLTIAGIVQDRSYFEQLVEPRIDGERVRYFGPVAPDRRGEMLGGARALLHLVNFDEPFGFSVVEAMACGTPVIASVRGSMPEIVRDGESGFLVGGLDEAVAAVGRVEGLDRAAVRASVERRFDVNRMVDDYLALYRRIAN